MVVWSTVPVSTTTSWMTLYHLKLYTPVFLIMVVVYMGIVGHTAILPLFLASQGQLFCFFFDRSIFWGLIKVYFVALLFCLFVCFIVKQPHDNSGANQSLFLYTIFITMVYTHAMYSHGHMDRIYIASWFC